MFYVSETILYSCKGWNFKPGEVYWTVCELGPRAPRVHGTRSSGKPSPRLNYYLSLGEGLPEAPGTWYLVRKVPVSYLVGLQSTIILAPFPSHLAHFAMIYEEP